VRLPAERLEGLLRLRVQVVERSRLDAELLEDIEAADDGALLVAAGDAVTDLYPTRAHGNFGSERSGFT
jgi:hypothetical protein